MLFLHLSDNCHLVQTVSKWYFNVQSIYTDIPDLADDPFCSDVMIAPSYKSSS